MSADGLTLYFVSSRPDGFGYEDLYVSSLTRRTFFRKFQNIIALKINNIAMGTTWQACHLFCKGSSQYEWYVECFLMMCLISVWTCLGSVSQASINWTKSGCFCRICAKQDAKTLSRFSVSSFFEVSCVFSGSGCRVRRLRVRVPSASLCKS